MQDFECWFSGCQKTCAHEIMLRKLEQLAHLNRPKLRTRFTPRLIFSRLLFVKTNAQETQVLTLYFHYINIILHWERVHAQTSFPAARFQFYFILYLKIVILKAKISVKMTSPDDTTKFFICRIRMFQIHKNSTDQIGIMTTLMNLISALK